MALTPGEAFMSMTLTEQMARLDAAFASLYQEDIAALTWRERRNLLIVGGLLLGKSRKTVAQLERRLREIADS
jgi:hypothetical protein